MSGARGLRAERERERLRVEAAVALRRSLEETSVDQLDLADAAGVDASIVSRMMSSKCGNTVTIIDLLMWLADDETRPVALRLVQYIATQSGLHVAEKRTASSASDLLRLLASNMDAGHSVSRAITDAVCPSGEDGERQSDTELERIADAARRASKVACEVELAAESELATRRGGTRAVLS